MGLFPKELYEGFSWRRRHGEPKTRVQLFQCVFIDQFFSLIPVNLFYLLFWLPALAWSAFCLLQAITFMQSENGTGFIATMNTWTLGLVPCLTIVGPARAGMARLMRDWAREEYCKVLPTFWKGMKENWLQTIPFSLMTGLFPMAVWSAYQLSGGADVLFWVVCGAFALFLLTMQVFYVLLVTYDLKTRHHFRNAVLMLFMHPLRFVLVQLGSLSFVIAYVILCLLSPGQVLQNLLIPLVYYCIIGLAATELINASLANLLCDEHLNPKIVDQVDTETTL